MKQDAFSFLTGFQQRLNKRLPGPQAISAAISARWDRPPAERKKEDRLACRENIFLYHFVIPELCKYMLTVPGMDSDKIRRSVRCEYYKTFPELSSSNARRIQGHPFDKGLRRDPRKIMESWRRPKVGFALNEAYPDLCITAPFPFAVVFDAKFFTGEGPASAEEALVDGVHEVAFYRGLPSASSEYAARSGWAYDFGCLLAYDASPDAYLQKAWNSVVLRHLFWDDAHVFVMIVRGSN